MIGPFVDFQDNPILMPGSGFDSKASYNPVVMKEDEDYCMLYRAESLDDGLSGKIGLAKSRDGVGFVRWPPLVYHYAPTQRHRGAPPGPRHDRSRGGFDDALLPHARPRDPLSAGQ